MTVRGHETRDGQRYVALTGEFGNALVPVDRLWESVRHPVAPERAAQWLATLHDTTPSTSDGSLDDRILEYRSALARVRDDGDLGPAVLVLRRLYAATWPLPHPDLMARERFGQLVLGEIAHVLAVPQDALRDELRRRHGLEDRPGPAG